MADYLITDTEATGVADKIREKAEISGLLVYPNGFKEAIENISEDCNATAAQMLSGKTGMVKGTIITGTIPSKTAATYVANSNHEIASGQYLSGTQTILGVKTTNITPENVKKGVTITVGDDNSATRIKNNAGTMVPLFWGAPDWCPFMWHCDTTATPKPTTLSGESSGTAAQKATGQRFITSAVPGSGAEKTFRVPCKIKITFYQLETSTSTTTATLTTGTDYKMVHESDIYLSRIYHGTTMVARIYKLISYERV